MTVFKEVLCICDSPLNAPALRSHPLTKDRLLVLVFHQPIKTIMRCCGERMNRNRVALVKPQKYGGFNCSAAAYSLLSRMTRRILSPLFTVRCFYGDRVHPYGV